ncbi:MAG: GntR family transcriptional regulator [Chloroflexi bacterium]|nr:GntR family transcriptional regulator [Chloroflexota bacterium]
MSLITLFSQAAPGALKLDRSSLKNQSTELLRTYIVSGRIPPGTKLAERELADLLGISRMPARDALMDLEREGLVVSKPNGRYVIEVSKEDVQNLLQVRLELEKLAVTLAAQHTCPAYRAALETNLQQMRKAIQQNDRNAYIKSDLEAHELIWQQAHNPYLLKMLHSIMGPIFMFIASHTEFQTNWHETLQMHEALASAISVGDAARAVKSIEEQLENSRQLSLRIFV